MRRLLVPATTSDRLKCSSFEQGRASFFDGWVARSHFPIFLGPKCRAGSIEAMHSCNFSSSLGRQGAKAQQLHPNFFFFFFFFFGASEVQSQPPMLRHLDSMASPRQKERVPALLVHTPHRDPVSICRSVSSKTMAGLEWKHRGEAGDVLIWGPQPCVTPNSKPRC